MDDKDGPGRWTRRANNESERERPRAQQCHTTTTRGLARFVRSECHKQMPAIYLCKKYTKRARGGVPRPRWCWRAHDQRPPVSKAKSAEIENYERKQKTGARAGVRHVS